MNKVQLKNTILAIAHHILSTCSEEALEDAVIALQKGEAIHLKPHAPVNIDDYDNVIHKITRALKPRPFVKHKADKEKQPHKLIKMVQINVPITMNMSCLTETEKDILMQNIDMPVLMTCHQTQRTKKYIHCNAKIGIQMALLHPAHKTSPIIDHYIRFYDPQTGCFLKNVINDAKQVILPVFSLIPVKNHFQSDLYQVKPP